MSIQTSLDLVEMKEKKDLSTFPLNDQMSREDKREVRSTSLFLRKNYVAENEKECEGNEK